MFLAVAVVAFALPAGAEAPPVLAAVQQVLDTRGAAVRDGDRDAFLGTVDPAAPPAFKDAQGRLFDGLRSVPLADYRLEARVADFGDLSAVTRVRYGTAPVFLPETRQRLRLRDYDATDAVDSLWLTFIQRGSRWFVAGDGDAVPIGLESARGLWDFGPVVAQPSPHFLVLSHPEQAERAAALGALAEEAVTVLGSRWRQPWPGQIPLVLPGSIDELRGILQSTIDLDKFVAFVLYGAVRDRGYEPTAPRIYIQDRNLSRASRAFQVETLVHELNHAAVASISGPFIPAWVHEGVAEWVATGQRLGDRRPAGAGAHMPRDFEFSTGPRAGIALSYRSSRAAMSALAQAKGVDAPAAFIKAVGEMRVGAGSVDYRVDQALRASAGLGMADLEALWGR